MTARRLSPARAWLLTAGLLGLATWLSARQLDVNAAGSAQLKTWLPLALGFGLAETCVVHMTVGRQTHSFAFSEIPLIVGLFLVSPAELVAACVAGTAVAMLVRRQPAVKLTFNVAQYWMGSLISVAVWEAVTRGSDSAGATSTAAILATVSTATFSAAAMAAVLRLVGSRQSAATTARVTATSLLTAVANAALAVVGVTVGRVSPMLLWSVLVVLGFLAVAQRSHVRLQRRHDSLHRLNVFAAELSRADSPETVAQDIVRGAVVTLVAAAARLTLRRPDGSVVTVECDGDGVPRLVDTDHAPDGPEEALSALSAPVTIDGELSGELTVYGNGNLRPFGVDEQHLLNSLAQHAAAALAQCRLTERLRAQVAENEYQATHDVLTGLANRVLFERTATALIDEGDRPVVMLLDLDRFKDVNDTLGHAAGDALLNDVGRRLLAAVPQAACIARLGGDEFTILLRGGDAQAAKGIAEAARVALLEPLEMGSVHLSIDASIGIATSPVGVPVTCSEMLRHADVAMYAAKAARSAIEVYHEGIDHNDTSRLGLVADLRAAIEQHDLDVVFQPKVALGAGGRSVEALVRWTHPTQGPMAPDLFIPIAEQTGMIVLLTDLVLGTALTECRRWLDEGLDITVAINISPRVLRDATFPARLHDAFERHRVPATRVILEITEGAVMADLANVIDMLWTLRKSGVQLAIDDLGVGQSSLAYLKQLPVHEVKIDKSFVLSMADDEADDAIVCAVVGLAHRLGLRVVAEGVETERTLDRLREIGCDVAQGYYYSRPLPASQVETFFRDGEAGADVPRQRQGHGGGSAAQLRVSA